MHDVMWVGKPATMPADNACRWLHEYFGAPMEGPARLPEPLRRWLRDHPLLGAAGDHAQPRARAFSVEHEGRRLVMRFIPDRALRFLLLEEHTLAPSATGLKPFLLTPWESEVLAWVTMGKTNRDIAAILSTSARTVKKHLEHVYEKLGVETRTPLPLSRSRSFRPHRSRISQGRRRDANRSRAFPRGARSVRASAARLPAAPRASRWCPQRALRVLDRHSAIRHRPYPPIFQRQMIEREILYLPRRG